MENSAKWQLVVSEDTSFCSSRYTSRLKVPGGWLYRIREGGFFTVTFVPETRNDEPSKE